MATRKTFATEITARARRVGWPVRALTGGGWVITCPDKHKVQVHLTPSDVNAPEHIVNELNKHGFEAAENQWLIDDEEKRQARMAEVRRSEQVALDKAQKEADSLARAAGQNRVNEDVLLSPYPVPKTIERVLVSPELAAKLLDLNTENRPVRQREVNLWKNILEQGEWRYTHQGIAIDSRGVLQDGQHRLTAILQTNISAELQISIGMPPENFAAIDVGLRRTFGDVVARHGYASAGRIGSTARLLALYNDWPRRPLNAKVSNAEVDLFVGSTLPSGAKVGEVLHEAVSLAQMMWQSCRINSTGAAAGIYKLWEEVGKDHPMVESFFEGLRVGANLDEKDPRFALRRYCSAPVRRDRSAVTHLSLFIKTWNKFVSGQKVEALAFRKNEELPTILVPSEE